MNWETILGIITHPIVTTTLIAVAGVAIKGFVKYKKALKSFIDIPRAVLKARDPKSDGGKDITTEEYAIIGKHIVELAQDIGELAALRKGE